MEIWNDILAKLQSIGVDTNEEKDKAVTPEKKKETLFDGELPDSTGDYSVLSKADDAAPAVGSSQNAIAAAQLSAAKSTASANNSFETSKDGRLKKGGVPFTGVYSGDGKRYVAGRPLTGFHNGVEYENGVIKASSGDPVDPGTTPTSTVTPTAQKGTKEYAAQLLNLNLDNYDVAETDEQGRVTKLKIKGPNGSIVAGGDDYEITYNDDNTITITTRANYLIMPGKLYDIEKTFDENGKLVREFYPENGSLGGLGASRLIEYNNDGSKVETIEYGYRAQENGVAKEIISYDAKGNAISTVKYDADGKEIKDTTTVEPKIGELGYIGKMLGIELDENKFNIKIRNDGNIIKLEAKRMGGDSYLVAYGNNGEIKITEYKRDLPDAERIQSTFDRDGNLTKTIVFGGLSGDSVETLYGTNGKVTQKTVQYGEPRDGVAKVVTTYKADGTTVDSVKNFDAQGKEISSKPTAEFGSKEYITTLINNGISNNVMHFDLDKYDVTLDTDGKVSKLTLKSTYVGTRAYWPEFNISYADGNKVVIEPRTPNIADAPTQKYTFQNGELIQTEKIENGNGQIKTVTDYANGKKTQETKTFDGPAIQDGVARIVTTYKADGVTVDSVKKYDADNNEITETTIPAGEKGSVEYTKDLMNKLPGIGDINYNDYDFVTDDSGKVVQMKIKSGKYFKDFNDRLCTTSDVKIKYNDDGSVTINPSGNPYINTPLRDISFTFKDGELVQKTDKIAGQDKAVTVTDYENGKVKTVTQNFKGDAIENGVAKIVTTYKADGVTVDSVKKYDADNNEIPETTIPAGEKGSFEFMQSLLGLDENVNVYNKQYDSQGRIVSFVTNGTKAEDGTIPAVTGWPITHTITYSDNGNIDVKKQYPDKTYEIDTYDSSNKLIQNKVPYEDGTFITTDYSYNGDKLVKELTKYKDDVTKEKLYLENNTQQITCKDKDGNVIYTITDKRCDGNNWPRVNETKADEAVLLTGKGDSVAVKDGASAVLNADGSIQITDKSGKIIKSYDAQGNEISVTGLGSANYFASELSLGLKAGDITAVETNADGKLKSFTDKSGNTYNVTYSADGKTIDIIKKKDNKTAAEIKVEIQADGTKLQTVKTFDNSKDNNPLKMTQIKMLKKDGNNVKWMYTDTYTSKSENGYPKLQDIDGKKYIVFNSKNERHQIVDNEDIVVFATGYTSVRSIGTDGKVAEKKAIDGKLLVFDKDGNRFGSKEYLINAMKSQMWGSGSNNRLYKAWDSSKWTKVTYYTDDANKDRVKSFVGEDGITYSVTYNNTNGQVQITKAKSSSTNSNPSVCTLDRSGAGIYFKDPINNITTSYSGIDYFANHSSVTKTYGNYYTYTDRNTNAQPSVEPDSSDKTKLVITFADGTKKTITGTKKNVEISTTGLVKVTLNGGTPTYYDKNGVQELNMTSETANNKTTYKLAGQSIENYNAVVNNREVDTTKTMGDATTNNKTIDKLVQRADNISKFVQAGNSVVQYKDGTVAVKFGNGKQYTLASDEVVLVCNSGNVIIRKASAPDSSANEKVFDINGNAAGSNAYILNAVQQYSGYSDYTKISNKTAVKVNGKALANTYEYTLTKADGKTSMKLIVTTDPSTGKTTIRKMNAKDTNGSLADKVLVYSIVGTISEEYNNVTMKNYSFIKTSAGGLDYSKIGMSRIQSGINTNGTATRQVWVDYKNGYKYTIVDNFRATGNNYPKVTSATDSSHNGGKTYRIVELKNGLKFIALGNMNATLNADGTVKVTNFTGKLTTFSNGAEVKLEKGQYAVFNAEGAVTIYNSNGSVAKVYDKNGGSDL